MTPVTNSEIACFQRCEREWQHRYIDHREGLQPAETLSRGKRMHAALSGWWSSPVGALISSLAFDPSVPPAERAMIIGYAARYEPPHLRDVRVNVPFRTTIGGVEMVGECDAVGTDPDTGDTVIVEHKTTSHDVTSGSAWWRERVHCDSQPSTYLAAFPGATVCYDVLHVPDIEQAKATPEDKRKYTKAKPNEPSRLYAGQRSEDETDEEYIARVLSDMADKPEKYFQRAVVVRLDSEREAFEWDVKLTAERMRHPMRSIEMRADGTSTSPKLLTVRNPRSCFTYGRACDFFEVCWQGRSIDSLPLVDRNHSEEMLERWEKSR